MTDRPQLGWEAALVILVVLVVMVPVFARLHACVAGDVRLIDPSLLGGDQ